LEQQKPATMPLSFPNRGRSEKYHLKKEDTRSKTDW